MHVGIDLGTTYSLVSRISSSGQPVLIPDHSYREVFSTPSKVYIGHKRALVGYLVDLLTEQTPDLSVLKFFKRQFGNPKPLLYDKEGNAWHPEAVAGLLLKKLRYDAEHFTGQNVEAAVITVPAHFNDLQRKAILNAAHLANIQVLGLVEEPVAAALHYGVTHQKKENVTLVYDLGGGTFDATIMTWNEKGVYVLSKEGITDLGGKEFDEIIAAYILDEFKRRYNEDLNLSASNLLQLNRIAEEVKIDLSGLNVTYLKKRLLLGGKTLEIMFSRPDFEQSISHYVKQSIQCIENCVRGAGLKLKDIDTILLVGGSSMIPLVRNSLKEIFSGDHQQVLFHEPMKAVAFGAAIHAAQLSGQGKALGIPPELKGITGYHLGVRTINPNNGKVEIDVLIRKNIPLPVSVRRTYYTTKPGQDQIVIELVQYLHDHHNVTTIGELVVGPLPNPRANYPIDVSIHYTEDGTIRISAYDPETGVELEKTFGQEKAEELNLLKQRQLIQQTQINNFF